MYVLVAMIAGNAAAPARQDTATADSGLSVPFQGTVRDVGSGVFSWIESVTGLGPLL